ncbi:MAG: UDP-N-acetylmuramoyl-tripeptide--D-alanyl-D-alanine ligase [Holosporales bacterium]|nr:UDP-N-acetylmuramoyl-tripeptide--D-alanyl-D-alanine ligase [Holosporales bacterium]
MRITNRILEQALKLKDCPEFEANRISIDSRDVKGGELFIAIKDGNKFAKEAIKNGAVLAIIDSPEHTIPNKTIAVKDSVAALRLIGKYIKDSVDLKAVVGITGSIGKTTTRTWLSSILNHRFAVVSSIKNYNTMYGLPICLSMLEKNTDFGIFEIGSNNPGEITELSNYLNPNIGVITNIYESHIGRFKNVADLAKEKISIIDGVKQGGNLIYNGDSEFAPNIVRKAKTKKLNLVSVGFNENCDFSIISRDESVKEDVKVRTPLGVFDYQLNAKGRHFAYISACVLAVLYSMKLNASDFLEYFKNLEPLSGRGKIGEYTFKGKTFRLIDDSYNASPTSLAASLDVLNKISAKSKIAVIGQMKELGEKEEYYHESIAKKLHSMKIERVFFVGDKNLWEIMKVQCFEKLDDFVIEKILENVQNDSVVLLKGSRSMELDKIINYIRCSTI